MLTNTTNRTLLSLGPGGGMYPPGAHIDVDPATLPEWDAVRRAFDAGELRAVVVSAAPPVPVEPEPVAELPDGKPELWKMVKARGLDDGVSYRTATVDDLRALLGGE